MKGGDGVHTAGESPQKISKVLRIKNGPGVIYSK